ncbi:hypothetical protein [Caballeronia sp. LjRoot31]|uniref:hypothetical protein n=1 Tax=Caballeronia sp. LjRoot31 TaxID=3342324 RepID=UPI003ECE90B7
MTKDDAESWYPDGAIAASEEPLSPARLSLLSGGKFVRPAITPVSSILTGPLSG